jgi:poly(A) polymerase
MRQEADRIVRALRDAGHVAYFAGGCVRDMLLGNVPSDYDVATSAMPEDVLRLFRKSRKVGAKFGVVLVRSGRAWVEVATFRKDLEYVDGRHPTGVTTADAKEDAARRDFTINGMFYDPVSREVVDYVGGRADLTARLIRAIGEPSRRFAEDHLRMLRAIRFAARLSFDIEPVTREAIRSHASEIRRISAERIREELDMMLAHASCARAFELMCDSELLVHLFPGAERVAADRESVRRQLDALEHADESAGFAILFSPLGPQGVKRACRALRFSNRAGGIVVWLVENEHALDEPARLTLADLKLLMARPAFATLMHVYETRLRAEGQSLEPVRTLNERLATIHPEEIAPPPLVTGEDLEKMGVEKGPIYKRILDRLYYMQLNLDIRTPTAGLEVAKQLLKNECN